MNKFDKVYYNLIMEDTMETEAINKTNNYVKAVREEIIDCDEFCNALSKWLKAVNNDAPSAEEIKNKLQSMYESGEFDIIRDLTENKLDSDGHDEDLVDWSIESNDGLNLKIKFLVNEKAKELVDLKVGLRFKS